MSRTYRRVPPEWHSWGNYETDTDVKFNNKFRRGHTVLPISDPDDPYGECLGVKGKRWAKKRKSRKRRLVTEKIIREQLLDK